VSSAGVSAVLKEAELKPFLARLPFCVYGSRDGYEGCESRKSLANTGRNKVGKVAVARKYIRWSNWGADRGGTTKNR
jgi:hypothetical protein